MKTSRNILVALLVLVLSPSIAQQLRFKHITSEEGLSTNFVRTIVQDDLGFMWFGTQDGLNKYDGYQIKVFKNDPTNPNSLSCSDVTALKQVKQNLILVGTREGLNFSTLLPRNFRPCKRWMAVSTPASMPFLNWMKTMLWLEQTVVYLY